MKLRFLGTGGGRYVTGKQKRRTAGITVETEETKVHIDPGPGGLVYANQQKPEDTEAVIVSHAHPDHSNDAEALIEMMTEAYNQPGAVFANKTAMEGHGDIEKVISEYHKNLCLDVETLEEGGSYEFRDLKIRSQEMFHGDPNTQGFTLETEEKKIGFWTDTEYSDELLPFYEDCDTVIIYCTRPRGKSVKGHTAISDIPEIMENTEASTAIITHFGYAILEQGLEEEKKWLKEEIDEKVIFAEDEMQFPGDKKLSRFTS